MTQSEIEQAIHETLEEITKYKAVWLATGDEAARKKMKELQILQLWYLEQYDRIKEYG